MSARALRSALLRFVPALFLRVLSPRGDELGECGEELAARYLRGLGWRLLGRRLPTPDGEIDIVAEERGELVCVEVKTGRVPGPIGGRGVRSPALRWRPGMRLGARTLAHQRRAGCFLARTLGPRRLRGGRVDLIEVAVHEGGRRFEITHHRALQRPI